MGRSGGLVIGVAAFIMCAVAGCQQAEDGGGPSEPESDTLTGTVLYRERMALPADATIVVRLEDVSRADAPADVIASQTIAADGRQVPIPFALVYAPERIEPNRSYAVRAEIRAANGDLMFTTTTRHAVLEPGAASSGIEIVVQRASNPAADGPVAGGADPAQSTGSLVGETWRLVAIARPGAQPETVSSDQTYTIEFGADGRYFGQAHCNRFTGAYERPGPDRLAMSAGAATLAACLPPSISDEFLRTVADATHYLVRGDELELSTDDGRRLTFTSGSAVAAAPPEVGQTSVFDCPGGESFTVRTGPGEVALWAPLSLGGQYAVLGLTQSASGARYADGDTVFWNRGEYATIELAGRTFVDCRSNPSKVPWADAARRGATFRALGNEPGWSLEVHPDRLVMVTNLGADRAELPHGGPVVEGARTTYRAEADGRELVAVIERSGCTDTMSGEAFEAAATVTFGGETFRGCGRFL